MKSMCGKSVANSLLKGRKPKACLLKPKARQKNTPFTITQGGA